jgi:hypothetical protein
MTTPMPLITAPYISPTTLLTAPTGIDWGSIPVGDEITPAQNEAEWWNMCARATAKVDGYCNQILRATADVEILHGPDYRVTTGPGAGGSSPTPYWGNAGFNTRAILARFPILQVTQVQVSPNTFPRHWQTLPANWAEPEYPPFGIYNSVAPASDAYGGQAIIIGPGFVNRCLGRNGFILMISYVNGWPHAEITSQVAAGVSTVSVSDCTGWGITSYQGTAGATGVIKDSGQQETVHVSSASVTTGPGTLTLAAPLVYPHAPGTIITTLPASIEQACILFATAEALTRGATTTTIHDIGGHSQNTGGDVVGLTTEAELLCHPYKRTI